MPRHMPHALPSATPFRRSIAAVIGINAYAHGIPPLQTAVNDARRLADILATQHGYETITLLDGEATHARLVTLLTEELPARVSPDDRVCFYFAGHGVALDGDQGPNGYLLPQDARRGDEATYLNMPLVHDALLGLACRHMLVIASVRTFISRREWSLVVARPEHLQDDLRCAAVLWYGSDWDPPADFAATHVPLIERFVREGGGLLVGGLGWSYADQGPDAPYAADALGAPFGFKFTLDAFRADPDQPIPLLTQP